MGSGWFLETVYVKHLIMALVPKEKKKDDKKKKKKKKKDEEDEEEVGGEEMREVVVTYCFPCSRWLANGEDDDELVVELLPEDADELQGILIVLIPMFVLRTFMICFDRFQSRI